MSTCDAKNYRVDYVLVVLLQKEVVCCYFKTLVLKESWSCLIIPWSINFGEFTNSIDNISISYTAIILFVSTKLVNCSDLNKPNKSCAWGNTSASV